MALKTLLYQYVFLEWRGYIICFFMSTVVANCHVVCEVALARRVSEVIAVKVVGRRSCAEDVFEWEEVVAADVVRWRSSRGPRRRGLGENQFVAGSSTPAHGDKSVTFVFNL